MQEGLLDLSSTKNADTLSVCLCPVSFPSLSPAIVLKGLSTVASKAMHCSASRAPLNPAPHYTHHSLHVLWHVLPLVQHPASC